MIEREPQPIIVDSWASLVRFTIKKEEMIMNRQFETKMQKYGEVQPTGGLDPTGTFFLPERQEWWYVVPCSQTRDSECLSQSNFDAAIKILGGERQNIVEVHRFSHWGPGWFEIIIVNPAAGVTMNKAIGIESSLSDYPVLDDDDYSSREWDEMSQIWGDMNLGDRVDLCKERGESVFAARHETVPRNVYAENLGMY